jgi:hypothetical protein
MGCRDPFVKTVRVGLKSIGIVGLRDALDAAVAAGLTDRDAIVDRMMKGLAEHNHIPDRGDEDYRTAAWREYLRHTGQDFSAFFSPVEVTVHGEAGEDRDRFVDLARSVFAELELRPAVTFAAPREEGPNPQLVIDGEVIAKGNHSRVTLKSAIHRTFSDW